MKDGTPLLAEDLLEDAVDEEFDDDFEPEELDAEEDWPLVEDVRRLLNEH